MTTWEDVLAAIGIALSGDRNKGQHSLRSCWAGASETAHAQRCVLAHYLADLETDLAAEVGWDEQALASYAHISDADLAPVGIPAAAGLAPSLHLNLGDGYARQGRTGRARHQLEAGLAALGALPDDGYGTMIRRGLTDLQRRLAAPPGHQLRQSGLRTESDVEPYGGFSAIIVEPASHLCCGGPPSRLPE